MRKQVYIYWKPGINLESSIACEASAQFLCIHSCWWDCWPCESCFIKSFLPKHKPHLFPIVMKMMSIPCEQEKRSLIASIQLQNSQTAASFQHTQLLLLLQSVTSLVNHPLFISKLYVKLCSIAFYVHIQREEEKELLKRQENKNREVSEILCWGNCLM